MKASTRMFFLMALAAVLGLLPVWAAAGGPDVYYAGTAYSGKFADVSKNFPYTQRLNSVEEGRLVEKNVRDMFKSDAGKINCFNLKFEKAESSNRATNVYAMAVAVTREDFGIEQMRDGFKVVLNLGVKVIFVNMTSKTFAGSWPVNVEFIDFQQTLPDDTYKHDLVRKAWFGGEGHSILSILSKETDKLTLGDSKIRTIQVVESSLSDKAANVLFAQDSSAARGYSYVIAQNFSDELVRSLGVTVLPIGRDSINGKMSLVYADGKEQDFSIPEASYSIVLCLDDLQRKDLAANNIERAYAFGAFLLVKVSEPESKSVYFDQRIIHGASKKVAATSGDFLEAPVYKEVVGLVVKKAVKAMKDDKKFEKEVLKRCLAG